VTAFLADLIKGPTPEPVHAALRQRWDVGGLLHLEGPFARVDVH